MNRKTKTTRNPLPRKVVTHIFQGNPDRGEGSVYFSVTARALVCSSFVRGLLMVARRSELPPSVAITFSNRYIPGGVPVYVSPSSLATEYVWDYDPFDTRIDYYPRNLIYGSVRKWFKGANLFPVDGEVEVYRIYVKAKVVR